MLAGVAVWQLGIEFERAWVRSYDAPVLGEPRIDELLAAPQRDQTALAPGVTGQRRRWVASPHARGAATAPRITRQR